ncbi:MAG: hypothetical protein QHH10_03875 [Peptococcaceae bacterium]|jgi:uncharacterized membrane protein|nr:hypothetical protein [Peptococcaceae bacterium]MDH7524437.1 hypothetical protein [Peptococcaceae bacterium]
MLFWRDQKGGASAVTGAITVMIAMMLLALAFDTAYLYARRDAIKQALDYSNMAVYRNLDREKLADRLLAIEEIAAQDTFREFLAQNLRLDGNLNPLPGSLAAGPVQVADFRVFNPEDLPNTDGLGNPVTEVSVYSRVRVPVKPLFAGLFAAIPVQVAITTDIPEGLP